MLQRGKWAGAGPYKFVSHNPGVDLVLEANETYWRKTPHVKCLVFKGIPDSTTRLVALKKGEIDISSAMNGEIGRALQADPQLTTRVVSIPTTYWLEFSGKWDPKSPWHDQRVWLAANYAIDRQAIMESETLGFGTLTGSIVPRNLPHALPLEPLPYGPARARQLLKEAGYANGFDAGAITPFPPATPQAEAVANDLGAVGIKLRVRTMERPTMITAWRAKTFQGVVLAISGALSSAAAGMENYVVSWGEFAYGGSPDLDALFHKQARDLDRQRREELLHEMQRLVHDRVMFVPIYESAGITGIGPRVAESGPGPMKTCVSSHDLQGLWQHTRPRSGLPSGRMCLNIRPSQEIRNVAEWQACWTDTAARSHAPSAFRRPRGER